jgi:glutamyl-tRNA synthetase
MPKNFFKSFVGLFAKTKVVTRFAPSPTGLLHAGNYRTAVFSYLFARQNNGSFIVRIEDTDKERSKKEYEKNILDSLTWLGLEHDHLYHQSERSSIHKEHLHTLVKKGFAYVSKETPKEPGDRTEVIRFKNPKKKVSFRDLIRGEIEFDTTELGDFVIAKSFDEPVFHFAVVVDDWLMGVTHIIRGEDHISNTPRQLLILEALGGKRPIYAHLPLVLAPDRSKLSKRKGALAITEYRSAGYLPEAVLNYMSLLGWNPGTEQELFSKEELISAFKIDRVQKAGAIFDEKKLRWMNREHLKGLPDDKRIKLIADRIKVHHRAQDHSWVHIESTIKDAENLIFDRIETLGDIDKLISVNDIDYLFEPPHYTTQLLRFKGTSEYANTMSHLANVKSMIHNLKERPTKEEVKAAIMPYADEQGRGDVLWPLRVALTGLEKSPDPFSIIEALGSNEAKRRIDFALMRLKRAHDGEEVPVYPS